MRIPLANRLKKRSQAEIAKMQDEVADIMYSVSPKAVFHGGTAIWRCYGGNRFSEDLDFYSATQKNFRELISAEAEKKGLAITKSRETKNSIYMKIAGQAEVSLEIALRQKSGIVAEYEKADGTSMSVLTLPKEDLLLEKANAFVNRKLIRDIYDVYFLSTTAEMGKARKELLKLITKFQNPIDEENLKTIVFSGVVPSYAEMRSAIERRLG